MKFRTIDLYNKIYAGETLTKKCRNAEGEIIYQDKENKMKIVKELYGQPNDMISQYDLTYWEYFNGFMLEEWDEVDE